MRVQHELDLQENLAMRRLKVVRKIQEAHPEIADDVWGALASQMNVQVGEERLH